MRGRGPDRSWGWRAGSGIRSRGCEAGGRGRGAGGWIGGPTRAGARARTGRFAGGGPAAWLPGQPSSGCGPGLRPCTVAGGAGGCGCACGRGERRPFRGGALAPHRDLRVRAAGACRSVVSFGQGSCCQRRPRLAEPQWASPEQGLPLLLSLTWPRPPRVRGWGFLAPVGIEAWLFPGAGRPCSCTSHGPYPGWEPCSHHQRRKLLVGERSRGSQMKVKPIQMLEKSFPSENDTGPFWGPFPALLARGRGFLTREGWAPHQL